MSDSSYNVGFITLEERKLITMKAIFLKRLLVLLRIKEEMS